MRLGWLRAVAQGYNYSCSNMELGLGLVWSRAVAQDYRYSYNKMELKSNIWLGLVCLRAVARVYSHSYSKIELGTNFQKNLMSWGVTLGWGLDGCARRRKVTITVRIK